MYKSEPDVLSQYERLSKAAEKIFNIKIEDLEANPVYIELKKVRSQLAEMEKNFPEPAKKPGFLESNYFTTIALPIIIGVV